MNWKIILDVFNALNILGWALLILNLVGYFVNNNIEHLYVSGFLLISLILVRVVLPLVKDKQ